MTKEIEHDDLETQYELVPIGKIQPDPAQPRRRFDEVKLEALAKSIKTDGLVHPITIKPSPTHGKDGTYTIIAGERRWRAFKLLGRPKIPALIRRPQGDTFMLSLVENVHRQDLNPIEEASAVRKAIREHKFTQAEVGERVGRSIPWVRQRLMLLVLPQEVQDLVAEGKLPSVQALELATYRGAKGKLIRLAHDLVAARLGGDRAIRAIKASMGQEGDEGLMDLDLMEGARTAGTAAELDDDEREQAREDRAETVNKFGRMADALKRLNKALGELGGSLEGVDAIKPREAQEYWVSLPERTRGRLLLLALQNITDMGILFELAKAAGTHLPEVYQYEAMRSGTAAGPQPSRLPQRDVGGIGGEVRRAAKPDVPDWLVAAWAMLLHPDGPTRSMAELTVRTSCSPQAVKAFLDGAFATLSQAWDGKLNGANTDAHEFCDQLRAKYPGVRRFADVFRKLPQASDAVALEIPVG